MKKEVISAVNFLVDLLRVNNSNSLLTEEQLVKFRKNIYECLWLHYKDHWFPDKPMKGSGYRCIRINGKMDPLIIKAGELMGIAVEALRRSFPSELTMWVDPSEVAYRIGENGSICQLYVQKSKGTTQQESTAAKANSQQQQEPEEAIVATAALLYKSQPPTPGRSTLNHHQPTSSPQSSVQQLKSQQQQFSPSKSPPPPAVVHSMESPSRSPVFNVQQQVRAQQQQLAIFLMNSQNTSNCKDSLRASNMESVRGMERLFVSS